MANISAADVKKLREMTGAGMMDCKNALVETGGDFDAAVTFLREKGIAGATKKAERAANEGAIGTYVIEDGGIGGIVEVNCETDFVARNEQFRALVADLAYQVAHSGTPSMEEFLSKPFIKDDGKTVEEKIKEQIGTIGENIVVARIATVAVQNGEIGAYVHSDGKKGALVVIEGAKGENALDAARGVAMQAVALRAPYLNRDAVPSDVIEAEKAIYRSQAAEEGKPEAMQDKIAEGRLNKYFKENTLVEQAFIRDDKKSVQQIAKDAGGTVVNFVRFEVGQTA